MPNSKTCDTFRADDCTAIRASLGTPAFGNDFAFAAKRYRFVRQHIAERRPARIRHGFRHVGLHQLFGVHVSNENLREAASDVRRRDVQEMLAPVGDLRRQGAGANRLAALLKQGEISFLGAVVPLRGDLFAGRKRREVFQPKVNAYRLAYALVGFGEFNLNIDVPATARVGRKFPRLRLAALGDRPRLPEAVCAAEHGQLAAVELGRAGKVGERHEIETALVGSKARRLGKAGVAGVSELATDGVNRIGVDSEFFRDAATQIGEVESRGALAGRSGLVAPMRLAVCLATEIPDEIDGASLTPKGVARSAGCVLDAVSKCQDQGAGRSSVDADTRSRARGALTRSAGSLFVLDLRGNGNKALTRPAIPPRPEGRGFSRRTR